MKKLWACFFIGIIILITGIYTSTFFTTTAVVIGTVLVVFGGTLIGGSSYFLPQTFKK